MSLLARLLSEADASSPTPSLIPIPVRIMFIRGKLKALRQWLARTPIEDTVRLCFAERKLDFLLPTFKLWYPAIEAHWKELIKLARELDNHYFDIELELRLPPGMADTIKEIADGDFTTII